jgi:hypothetical protein
LAPSPTKSAATGRALVASSLSRRTHARECRLRHDAAHVSSLTLPQQAQAPACQGATRRAVVTSKVTVVKQEQSLSSNSTSHLCGVSSHLGQPDWLSAVGSGCEMPRQACEISPLRGCGRKLSVAPVPRICSRRTPKATRTSPRPASLEFIPGSPFTSSSILWRLSGPFCA